MRMSTEGSIWDLPCFPEFVDHGLLAPIRVLSLVPRRRLRSHLDAWIRGWKCLVQLQTLSRKRTFCDENKRSGAASGALVFEYGSQHPREPCACPTSSIAADKSNPLTESLSRRGSTTPGHDMRSSDGVAVRGDDMRLVKFALHLLAPGAPKCDLMLRDLASENGGTLGPGSRHSARRTSSRLHRRRPPIGSPARPSQSAAASWRQPRSASSERLPGRRAERRSVPVQCVLVRRRKYRDIRCPATAPRPRQ